LIFGERDGGVSTVAPQKSRHANGVAEWARRGQRTRAHDLGRDRTSSHRAFVWPADGLTVAKPPTTGEIRLPEVSAVTFTEFEDRDYNQARAAWPNAREVLGQLGGEPVPSQGDGTPRCSDCGEPMRFVVQLEEGQDYGISANFGGSSAYAFACRAHPVATFLG
jgi:hypothetical protein